MQSVVALRLPISSSPSFLTAAKAPLRFLSWFARCIDRRQQRDALLDLDQRLLNDIGITRYEAVVEARKPFWKE
jgi:uncharacterized protein YjiS (DUF1127 family)